MKTHSVAGTITALIVAAFDTRVPTGIDKIFYLAGACLGGNVGGRLPDLLEPAYAPCHRQFFHAILPAIVAGGYIKKGINFIVTDLLEKAEVIPQIFNPDGTRTSPLRRLALFFAAGVFKGLPPGYLSHLALDFCTPACLPLFGKPYDLAGAAVLVSSSGVAQRKKKRDAGVPS